MFKKTDCFEELYGYNQFILYKLINIPGSYKKNKIPINYTTNIKSDPFDTAIWMSIDQAISMADLYGDGYGIGFALTEKDPFFLLDIDNCLLDNYQYKRLSNQLISLFNNAAIEISVSKTGIHILGKYSEELRHSCTYKHVLEFYTQNRFVALTGDCINAGSISTDCTEQLKQIIPLYFSKIAQANEAYNWTHDPDPSWAGYDSDVDVIKHALNAKSAKSVFGNSASFRDLWENNVDVLSRAYPPRSENKIYDGNRVDAALAQRLAYWTGNNCERILNLMQQSKLVREKWNRHDYLVTTILKACSQQKTFHTLIKVKPEITNVQTDLAKPTLSDNSPYLSIEQQLDLFTGCVYIRDSHQVFTPGGELLKPEQFKSWYGGYFFPLDLNNEKVTDDPWKAFIESKAFRSPRANSSCFKPALTPGIIINENDKKIVNIWWPINTPRKKGDVTLFLAHIQKLLPDERDQLILISYCAALIQFVGIKFHWCPIIQGVEGNGKSLISECLEHAIGKNYTHFPKPAQIAEKHNDWLYQKIIILVEDIKIPSRQEEILEALKPMITRNRFEIEPKFGAKVTKDICCNFLMNTNHKDGVKKTENNRIFAPFFTNQQNLEDLYRCGLDERYFSKLHNWLKHEDGYAIITDFLHTFAIPDEYNPATLCQRAPVTSSTDDAINASRGGIEQEILEAIEQGLMGFKNGWVSSIKLNELLEKLRATHFIPLSRRRELMQTLGYDWHPHLIKGRVNNTVIIDGGKPKLFIKSGHAARDLSDPAQIVKAYVDAQVDT
jgi:hypothetical protein